MKKLIALVMALTVMLSLCAAASAEDTAKVYWAEYEEKAAQLDPNGELRLMFTIGDTKKCVMWIPSDFVALDMSEQYIFAYGTEDDTRVVICAAFNVGDSTLEDLMAAYEEQGYRDVTLVEINDVPMIAMLDPEMDGMLLMRLLDNGDVINFVFVPTEVAEYQPTLECMIASILFLDN